jgi:hypothetical protein
VPGRKVPVLLDGGAEALQGPAAFPAVPARRRAAAGRASAMHSIVDTSDRSYLVKIGQSVTAPPDPLAITMMPDYTGMFGFPGITMWDHRSSFEET